MRIKALMETKITTGCPATWGQPGEASSDKRRGEVPTQALTAAPRR